MNNTEKDLTYYLALKYPINIVQDDDGSYFIEYPDLPGCMTCGQTLEEAINMGDDAKKCWLESALSNESFIPEPKAIEEYPNNFKMRMPRTLYKQLANDAKMQGVSMNQYCLFLLSNSVKN